jgi:chromosome segregation ATPase
LKDYAGLEEVRMSPESVDQKVAWLDEQQRKQTALFKDLSGRVESLEQTVQMYGRTLKELSADLARLGALAARINKFDEAMSRHRQEISHQLSLAEDRRSDKEKQLDQLHRADQEQTAKALDGFRGELLKLDAVQEWLAGRRDEEMRLTRLYDALSKQVASLAASDEDRSRQIGALQSTTSADGRRIADLQAEVSDLRVRSEGIRGAQDVVDDSIRRLDVKLADLAAGERERKEIQTLWIEQQGLRMVEVEKAWSDQQRAFAEMARQAEEAATRAAVYEDTHRSLSQLKAELAESLELTERRSAELVELQRLGEDRLKSEWGRFQADDLKRWNTFKLTADEQWREHERNHDKQEAERRKALASVLGMTEDMAVLRQAQEQGLSEMLNALQQWFRMLERD